MHSVGAWQLFEATLGVLTWGDFSGKTHVEKAATGADQHGGRTTTPLTAAWAAG